MKQLDREKMLKVVGNWTGSDVSDQLLEETYNRVMEKAETIRRLQKMFNKP